MLRFYFSLELCLTITIWDNLVANAFWNSGMATNQPLIIQYSSVFLLLTAFGKIQPSSSTHFRNGLNPDLQRACRDTELGLDSLVALAIKLDQHLCGMQRCSSSPQKRPCGVWCCGLRSIGEGQSPSEKTIPGCRPRLQPAEPHVFPPPFSVRLSTFATSNSFEELEASRPSFPPGSPRVE